MPHRTEYSTEDLFTFQRRIMRTLFGWGAGSAVVGSFWWVRGDAFWRGVGMQCAAWGAIDAAIALFGRRGANAKAATRARGAMTDAEYIKERQTFGRILMLNAGLDILYIVGGLLFARRNALRADRRGAGAGIIVQGTFLFVFDAVHAHTVITQSKEDVERSMSVSNS